MHNDADALDLAASRIRAELGHMIAAARALRLAGAAAHLARARLAIVTEATESAHDMRREAEELRNESGDDYLG